MKKMKAIEKNNCYCKINIHSTKEGKIEDAKS